ncbi:MAG: hypothetical protein KIS66_05990 [Fimbriimonadaceae bacterium]|nr:hypothetical protein [Fimbriimonadaceae bacterium]
MWRARRVGYWALALGASVLCPADVVQESTYGNAGFRVKIAGVNQGQEVTGTNVNFSAVLESYIPPNPPPPLPIRGTGRRPPPME